MSFPLNAPQREAVRYCDGPLLVLAGAGSGKTRVITAKIARLIEQGVDPARIVAVTFTNKAAREMRERAQLLLRAQGGSELAGRVTIATFHALGLKILRSEAKSAGLRPGFSILDPADLEGIVAELVATADRSRARVVQWKISAWKNARMAPADALASASDDDDPAFLRAVTTPKRGVGRATLTRLSEVATARGESLYAASFAPELPSLVPARALETLREFTSLIGGLRGRAEREPPGRLLDELLAGIGYEAWLVDTLDRRDAQERTKSVRDLAGWLVRKGEADGRNLLELTQMVALITMLDGREDDSAQAVRLSTLHAAKGLEFAHVFLVGLEEGVLPHRERIDAGDVDEERRLMYVGVTRARQTLHLSWCRSRKRAGERSACQPSRFILKTAVSQLHERDRQGVGMNWVSGYRRG
ncbi:MAG: UvrD-helicase domain-containing protein [Burkholderiales bacterium]|nr:UvrD-helicase domain-containing protein [Burkholderiales bacterium]